MHADGDGDAENTHTHTHTLEGGAVVSSSQDGGNLAGGSLAGGIDVNAAKDGTADADGSRDRLSDLVLLHDAVTFHSAATSEVEDVKTDLRIAMNRRKMEVVEGRVRGISLGGDTVVKGGGGISVGDGTARKSSTVGSKKTLVEDVGEMSLESMAKLLSLSVEEVGKIPRERLAKMVETQRVVDEVRRKIGEIRRVVGGEGERRRTW